MNLLNCVWGGPVVFFDYEGGLTIFSLLSNQRKATNSHRDTAIRSHLLENQQNKWISCLLTNR